MEKRAGRVHEIRLQVKGLEGGLRTMLQKLEYERELKLAQRVETEEKIRLDCTARAAHAADVRAWEGNEVFISRPKAPEERFFCQRVGKKFLKVEQKGREFELERVPGMLIRTREERLLDILDEKIQRATEQLTCTKQAHDTKIFALEQVLEKKTNSLLTDFSKILSEFSVQIHKQIEAARTDCKRDVEPLAKTCQNLMGFRSRVFDTLSKRGLINTNRGKEGKASGTQAVPAAVAAPKR